MLSIANPIMAMNMPCCSYAPYCAHSRHLPAHHLPSLGHGSADESWPGRVSAQHQTQYGHNRTLQPPLFPSQTLSYLNSQQRMRNTSGAYSSAPATTSWTSPSYPIMSTDFGQPTWLSSRTKDTSCGPGPSQFAHESSEYGSGTKYEGLELRDVSPSRHTDFSIVSASSQASPIPASTYMNYAGMGTSRDDSPFMAPQPLAPEQLRQAEQDSSRISPASYDSTSPTRYSMSRSRKGSEAVRCHICSKSFDRKSNFKSHWETHDKDRQRTVCKIEGCGKTFGRPAEMTRHVNSAHRQRSFLCSSCGKDFTRHDILLRHCKDACPVLVKGRSNAKKRRNKGLQ